MIHSSGVYEHEAGGWTWYCLPCDTGAKAPLTSRDRARNDFKAHRKVHSPIQEEKQMPATTQKKAQQKVAKKKSAPSTAKQKAEPTAKAKPEKKSKLPLFRFALITNKKGREVVVWVSKTGHFTPGRAEVLGRKRAAKWGQIRAATREEALVKLRKGQGEWFTPKGAVK